MQRRTDLGIALAAVATGARAQGAAAPRERQPAKLDVSFLGEVSWSGTKQ